MLRIPLLAAGLAGGALLAIADLSTLYQVRAGGSVTAAVSGANQHNYSLLVIGLAVLAMAVGAMRGSRAAAAAVAGLGLLALAIILIGGDLHDIHSTGVAGQLFERATAGPKSGFYEETLGVALLLVSGGGGLVLNAPPRASRPARLEARGAASPRPGPSPGPGRSPSPSPAASPAPGGQAAGPRLWDQEEQE
jgi:hypothetical protein